MPLHGVQASRQWEQAAASTLPPHTLMQRAGLAIARVALAVAPHSQCIWIACGPGNNGGDGLQAAAWLQRWGKQVRVSTLAPQTAMPADAQAAWQTAVEAGVCWVDEPPALQADDLCIDALLGLGTSRPADAAMQRWITAMRHSPAQILAVDVPSGLLADTGAWAGNVPGVVADHTITLLTLKPGLFSAQGRDAAGQVWWHDLDVSATTSETAPAADAWLQGTVIDSSPAATVFSARPTYPSAEHITSFPISTAPHSYLPHASHKGHFGDVCIIGGDAGMQGAAILAGEAALYAGAGRVYVGLLQANTSVAHDAGLMLRPLPADISTSDSDLSAALPYQQAITVCGCGGGTAIARWLPTVLQQAPKLLLDADALNAIAVSPTLQALLRQRARQGACTILTPHPLEAARLLQSSTTAIQNDRLKAAQDLADAFQCIVVLKGSGSVCALPAHLLPGDAPTAPAINYSGNALLATAGTGDVLAGCISAYWAQAHAHLSPSTPEGAWLAAWRACCAAVHAHGHVADTWNACTMRGSISGALDNTGGLQSISLPQPFSAHTLACSLCRPSSGIWQQLMSHT
ncbi:MAG: NAD(P)H-hydrate dehydratase [Brachymonas sp.]|nr:NAD(P)H-hydrate dehydratase [Brachymonas sp.]